MIADRICSLLSPRGASLSLDALNPRDPQIAKMLGIGRDTISGVEVNTDTALSYPAIFRGVSIIGNALMKVRPHVYRRTPDGKERAIEHPAWKVVTRQANPLMSAGTLRKTLVTYALLRGNGLAHIGRKGSGEVEDMTPLIPDNSGMAIFRNGRLIEGGEEARDSDEVRYWTRVGGEVSILQPEDVLHVKGLSLNGYWGIDVIEALQASIGLGLAARDSGARFFGQGNMAAGLLTAPPGLRDDQLAEFRKSINKGSGGLSKAHKFMILEEGANFTPFTIDPEKAQVLETRQFEVREVSNIIGVQAHKLGDNSQLSYNSLEQSNQEHLDDDLDPWLQVFEDEYECKCLSDKEKEDDTHFVEFNRKALVRTNLQARTTRHQFERQNGISSANDILRQENMKPIGPAGDTYMVPANMVVLTPDGLPLMTPDPPPEEPEEETDEPEGTEDQGENESSESEAFKAAALHAASSLAGRLCREAKSTSKKRGKFTSWLNRVARYSDFGPDAVAPTNRIVVEHIHGELVRFTEQFVPDRELEHGVLLSIEGIEHRAVEAARQQLEHLL